MRFSDFRSWLQLTAGLLLCSFGWAAFLIPSRIVSGGMGGLGQLLHHVTSVPVGVWVFLANGILVAVAVRVVGASFGAKTIYGIVVFSALLTGLQAFFPAPLVADRFMACLLGAILAGAGIGTALNAGGSTGGTDIIALIVANYRNVSPGKVILAWDGAVITASWFVFRSLESMVYGFVAMAVVAYVVDLLVEGAKQSVQFTIVSRDPAAIAGAVAERLNRGVTVFYGRGWYSGEDKEVLFVVVRRDESSRVLKLVHDVDPRAFLVMNKVAGAYGENFQKIKV